MPRDPEERFPWWAVVLSAFAAAAILVGGLSAQTISVENVAREPQVAWVTVPLPAPPADGEYVAGTWRAVVDQGVAYVRAELGAGVRETTALTRSPAAAPPFAFHPWLFDEIGRLLPSFVVTMPNGNEFRSLPAVPMLVEVGPARWRWVLETQIAEVPLVIRGHFLTFHLQPVVEFELRCSYGTTAPGQPLRRELGALRLEVGERPHIDFGSRKGLGPPTRVGNGWHQELSVPREWVRARTIVLTGALLCMPASDPYGEVQTPARDAILARIDGPVMGVAHGWDGHLGAFGRVASAGGQPWAATEQARRRAAFEAGRTRVGDELDSRPYGQPPASGTTGDQPDFGAIRAEHVRLDTAAPEPWAIYDLWWSVQAWMLRTYANREVTGAPVTRAAHPRTVLYNLRPDERIGTADMLGWPNPVGWVSGYVTSDSQHRSDNLLFAMWELTRSPSIEDTIRDILTLQSMELRREPGLYSGVGSPRGWGRPLVSLCHAASIPRFRAAAEPLVRQMVADMWRARAYGGYQDGTDGQVLVLSDAEAKYGWLDTEGRLIRAWLGWQESIALLGLFGAWQQFAIPEARQMILDVAPTIARWAFYRGTDGRLYHCYAVAVDPLRRGVAPPREAFTPGQPNLLVYTDGSCSSWTVTALHILLRMDGVSAADVAKCKEIIAAFGPPAGWQHACWWSL